MSDFPGVVTTFMRGLRSKIAASTVTSAQHRLYTDEQGSLYVGNGSTQLKFLSRVTRASELVINALDPKYGAVVDGTTDNTTALDAAFADSMTTGRPLYIPAGLWVYNGTGFSTTAPRVFGDRNKGTKITLGSGVSLIVSPTSAGSPIALSRLHIKNLYTSGGFGLIRLTYTGSQSGADVKIVEKCSVNNFTGAAVSSLASDDPYWKIDIFAGNGFSTGSNAGIGVALAGYTDACDVNVDGQGLFCTVKLGRGGNSANVRGSLVMAPYTTAPRAAVWIVPNPTDSVNAGRGLNISQFRFGSESYDARDYRVVYADEDTGTGADFATHPPLYGTASSGFIAGHRVTDCLVSGQGTAPAGPVVFSTTPNVRGCHYDVVIHSTEPSYILMFLNATLVPDVSNQTNRIKAQFAGTAQVTTTCKATNAHGAAEVEDPHGVFSRAASRTLAHPGTADLGALKSILTATPTLLAASATKAAVTDAMGGTDACEVTYSTASDALYGTWIAGAIDVGKPTWLAFDIRQGQTGTPLTDVKVTVRNGSSGLLEHRTQYFEPTSVWVRHLVKFTPRDNSLPQQLVFFPHNEAAGTIQIGRVDLYQARGGPLNVRGEFPDQVSAPGGVITKSKTSGTPSDADMTRPKDGAIIDAPAGLYVRRAGSWVKAGTSNANEFGGFARTVGDETFDRRLAGASNIPLVSGRLALTYMLARKSETATQIIAFGGSTVASGLTLGQIVVYSVDSSGNLTQVAITPNDTTLFGTASTQYAKSFSASFAKVAGQRYAVGFLFAGTTVPNLVGCSPFNGLHPTEQGIDPRLMGYGGTGLSSVPSTVSAGAIANGVGMAYAVIAP